MTLLNNPFVTSGYIAPEYFCDRERETEELLRWLVNENNVAIISTRRMGKTGLIQHCFHLKEIKEESFIIKYCSWYQYSFLLFME